MRLRDSLGVIAKARLPIGKDGRNRPSLSRSARRRDATPTLRACSIVRPECAGSCCSGRTRSAVYLDWRTQEVGIAAAYSGDKRLIEDYSSGDVYHALARMCGLTDDPDPASWKSREPGPAPKNEITPTRPQLRHGRPVIGTRPRSPSADC